MFRNLNTQALGVSGRQSELIELALSYGFKGVSIDMADLAKRARNASVEHACRFHKSARMSIGTFELPIPLHAGEDKYQPALAQLDQALAIADELDATRCVVAVEPGSDEQPYHENFEQHRKRIAEVADLLSQHGIRLGLGVRGAKERRQLYQYQFIAQTEDLITLIKTLGVNNVGLWLDAWNWKIGGGTLEQLKDLGVDSIVVVDLADAPADEDLGEIEETKRLLPGESGIIDSQSIVNLLRDGDYVGPVTAVPSPEVMFGRTRDNIVQAAMQSLERLWAAAGMTRSSHLAGVGAESREAPAKAAASEGAASDAAPSENAEAATAEAATAESGNDVPK